MYHKYLLIAALICLFSFAEAQEYSFGADIYIHCIDGGYGYIQYDAPLWVGTNHGVYSVIGGNDYFDSLNSPLPSNYITAIDLHYTDNNLWIGTNAGFCKKDASGNFWECFTTTNSGLPSDSITCMLDAGHDSIWIGTRNGLVLYLQALDSFQLFTTFNSLLPSNQVTCLERFSFEPMDDFPFPLFIGTTAGIAYIKNNNWTVFDTSNSGLSSNYITAIAADWWTDTDAWIATAGGGANHLIADTFINYMTSNQKIKSDTLQFIESLFDGDGVYTGNSFDSLYLLDYFDDKFTTADISKPVTSAFQRRGNGEWGWIGTDHDIYTFDFTEGIAEGKHPVLWQAAIHGTIVYLFNIPPFYGKTSLKIIDLLGQTVVEKTLSAGQTSAQQLTIPPLAAGVYLVQLQNATMSASVRVLKSY